MVVDGPRQLVRRYRSDAGSKISRAGICSVSHYAILSRSFVVRLGVKAATAANGNFT